MCSRFAEVVYRVPQLSLTLAEQFVYFNKPRAFTSYFREPQDALADNPEMLVDYVRVYTLEGQSVFVADPPEAASGSGSGLSLITAMSVLIALGIFFAICLVSTWCSRRSASLCRSKDSSSELASVVGQEGVARMV